MKNVEGRVIGDSKLILYCSCNTILIQVQSKKRRREGEEEKHRKKERGYKVDINRGTY
jgi:hypothetical protein